MVQQGNALNNEMNGTLQRVRKWCLRIYRIQHIRWHNAKQRQRLHTTNMVPICIFKREREQGLIVHRAMVAVVASSLR